MSCSSPLAILLVDGYNVIGSWSFLKNTRDRDGLLSSRQELIETLANYSAFVGYDTEIVFDAHSLNTPNSREVITNHLSVYYTDFGETADTYIEKFCASYRNKLVQPTKRLIVATSDRAQQLTVVGYGAQCISSQQLLSDVECTARRTRRKYRPQKSSRGRFLVNSLDAKAQQRLEQLRNSIK
ncbi:NYN domain-containing protein [Moorena sp. SIO4G3]|uniref:NYN domain-containing protein n=1 Tax=Moorena sp. SIO4G3 TaxID=2607821 RepID=UPI001429922F|nr:NYN domain-containing protein [Moorena sp. SIO4G3]NEO75148.1 NYN domain-containing protein [Moorena sp. SIO4G3]